MPNFEEYKEPGARAFWLVTGYLVQAVTVIALFAKLALLQARLLYVHVVCVFLLCELLGFAVLFAFVGHLMSSSLIETVIDYSVLAVWAVVGTEIGKRLRVAAEKKAELASNSPYEV